jgi:membrane-bound lytic murein transglycosylase MltF
MSAVAMNKSFLLFLIMGVNACSASRPAQAPAPESAIPAYESALPGELQAVVHQPFTGDYDAMVQRRLIRIGVPYNRTFYFIDKGVQRGLAYEYLKLFDDELNKTLRTGNLRVAVVLLPIPRDALLPALAAGQIDAAVAQLTVTPERLKLVDFSRPTRTGVNEIVVTGPGAPTFGSLDDLSGQRVFVRKTSSYYESLLALNRTLQMRGRPPVDVQLVSDNLEDDDLLEMVNAGLIPTIVVDDYIAEFWSKVFMDLTVHSTLALRTGGNLAVALRKNTPMLAGAINAFIAKYGLNTAMGQVLNQRYLVSTKFVKNAASEAERRKFAATVDLFRKYGDQYKLDFLLMAAQAFQESGLDQSARSQVGAIGVMQLMPATGKEQNVGDITKLEPNIHAGVKYVRFMMDQYYAGEPMDNLNKGLFTFASYNAGPGRMRQLRKEAEQRGLNPNVWFGNVEQVASERIGRETVTYVSNIYKYYIAYRLMDEEAARRRAAKSALARDQP